MRRSLFALCAARSGLRACADEFLRTAYERGLMHVRGSVFSSPSLSAVQMRVLRELVCDRLQLCYRCGMSGHLSATCPNGGLVAPWMQPEVAVELTPGSQVTPLPPPLPPPDYDHTQSHGPLPCSYNGCKAGFRTTCKLCHGEIKAGHYIVSIKSGPACYPSTWCHGACVSAVHMWRIRMGIEQVGENDANEAASAADAAAPGRLIEGDAFRRPSDEQKAVYHWVATGSGHAVIDAKAGAAKSSTLLAALFCIPNSPGTDTKLLGPLVLTFNKHNQMDLDCVCYSRGVDVEVNTFNSIGYRVWKSAAGHTTKISSKKVSYIFKALLPPTPTGAQLHPDARLKAFVKRAVGLAKCLGLGIQSDDTDDDWAELYNTYRSSLSRLLPRDPSQSEAPALARALALARQVLRLSREACYDQVAGLQAPALDFDDQVYMPLYHTARGRLPALDWQPRAWVCVDEAQDINAARKKLLLKLLAPGGRFIIVGDPFQALYGFTGATSDGMRALQTELNATRLPLSVCWRCPRSHLEAAAALCSPSLGGGEMPIQPRADAPEGTVCVEATFASAPPPERGTAVVLCRYNAPLQQLFRALLRLGWSVRLTGRAEVQSALLKRLGKAMRGANSAHLRGVDHLEQLLRADAKRVRAKAGSDRQLERKADTADDETACLLALLGELGAERDAGSGGASQLRGAALLTALEGSVRGTYGADGGSGEARVAALELSTVHKAKGKEWPLVYILQPDSLFGLRAALRGESAAPPDDGWEAAAECNCTYVALTRATSTLVLLRQLRTPSGQPFDPAPLLEGCTPAGDRNVRRRLSADALAASSQ